MDQRRNFILEWRSGTLSKTALCQLFGISRQTGYKWARRFKATRQWDALEERSRRPHRSPNATPPRLVKLIVSQRKQFKSWGPVPILHRLRTLWPKEKWPSASTIGAILKRHGLVRPRRKRLRVAPSSRPFAACREPNDLWCVDFKGQFPMGDGRLCYPLTVMDGASRYLLACVAFHEPTLDNVRAVFEELFRTHGLPKAIRSDNGEPVASTGAGGFSRLSVWWTRLGIRAERIEPGKPQQNGRHERMHLTLKQETCTPPRRSLGWQQRAFDRFRRAYNEVRPHQALDLQTPASLYIASPRRMPDPLPPIYYPFADVHRVGRDGTIQWRKRRVFIATTLVGELVGVHQLDSRYVQVVFARTPIGILDTQQPERGLIRPKIDRRRRSTEVSAMSPV